MTHSHHVAGPWVPGRDGQSVVAVVPDRDLSDCERPDREGGYGGQLIAESVEPRNIPIITAAPELLSLLQKSLPIVEQHKSPGIAMSDPWTRPESLIREIREAIAKAMEIGI